VNSDVNQRVRPRSVFLERHTGNQKMKKEIVTRTNLTCPECGFVEALDIPLNY
jgi:hypothetical protein